METLNVVTCDNEPVSIPVKNELFTIRRTLLQRLRVESVKPHGAMHLYGDE